MPAELVRRKSLVEWVRKAAPHRSTELDDLIQRLNPSFYFDRETDDIRFSASLSPNKIVLGVKASCRLQVHAYAGATVFIALGRPLEERPAIYANTQALLNWAVSRDLQVWLRHATGVTVDLNSIFKDATVLPEAEVLAKLTPEQRLFGEGFFRQAAAFVILHELAHLELGHFGCRGVASIQQEKEADRFAADWLLDAEAESIQRHQAFAGIQTALLWLTVFNVYMGAHASDTHPNPSERLYQVIDHAVDLQNEQEHLAVWHFVEHMLMRHMIAASFKFDETRMQGSPKEVVNYLMDELAKTQRQRRSEG